MIDKPSELVVLFGLAALVLTLGAIGYNEIQPLSSSNESTAYFSSVTNYANSSDYYAGAGADMGESLSGTEGTGGSSDSFIVQAGLGLLKIGKVARGFISAMGDTVTELHIPVAFYGIMLSMLLMTVAIAIYTWWRGK